MPFEKQVAAMTVDVEEWQSTTVLQHTGIVAPLSGAVLSDTNDLLDLFGRFSVRGTFFFLGEVATAFPELVRRTVDEGHEVGVHGYHHHQIQTLARSDLRTQIRKAKTAVEDVAGVQVKGYRAVDFGLSKKTWYLLDELLDAGFLYDSSLFPMRMPRYGMAKGPLKAHLAVAESGRKIFEVPLSVGSIAGLRFPFCGGGYLRLFPLWYYRFMARTLCRGGRPLVAYVHPCEINRPKRLDPLPQSLNSEQIRLIEERFVAETRGRETVPRKLSALFQAFHFGRVDEVFGLKNDKEVAGGHDAVQ